MRTNIDIDDKLLSEVLEATGLKTKEDAVELGLKTVLKLRSQHDIRSYRGRLQWQGDLEEMRRDS